MRVLLRNIPSLVSLGTAWRQSRSRQSSAGTPVRTRAEGRRIADRDDEWKEVFVYFLDEIFFFSCYGSLGVTLFCYFQLVNSLDIYAPMVPRDAPSPTRGKKKRTVRITVPAAPAPSSRVIRFTEKVREATLGRFRLLALFVVS